jgi:hypothetical protein
MERRQFLAASIATSAAALAGNASAQAPAPAAREFYQLRRYDLVSGPQLQLTQDYLGNALIPALGRMGLGPVGAFRLEYGQQTPMFYVLIPGSSVSTLATLDLHLGADEEFLRTASAFWNATATAPAFQRVEISLLQAFEGWPKLTPPPSTAAKAKRIFQLRTYESPSNGEHVRKVEMFHSGEFEIFVKSGCRPVFFSDTLFGSRLPSLTYMLSFENTAELEARWDLFRNDPDWKKLSASPRFAYDSIVSNISNLTLSPLACSQI